MMKILYLTNIEVPYRVSFFNELSRFVDLTVLYEREVSSNRDNKWAKSVEIKHKSLYLSGMRLSNENSFSLKICDVVSRGWDIVIVGCVNSEVQIVAMLYMYFNRIPFCVNFDGSQFFKKNIKFYLLKLLLKMSQGCLVAGNVATKEMQDVFDEKCIFTYNFTSLSSLIVESNLFYNGIRSSHVLVVGQYFDYKGLDVAFRAACMDSRIKYKFVGMGNRTEQFRKDMGDIPPNIEIIPFLQKEDLEEEYKKCSLLLLPSRQECWGLVINEAASFGTPIVSTWGCGAAVEFLSGKYEKYLAEIGSAESLLKCIKACIESDKTEYSNYLKEMSKKYTIERMVECHVSAFNQMLTCR